MVLQKSKQQGKTMTKILLSTFVSYQFPTLWISSIRPTYKCAVLKSLNYSDYIFTRALYRWRNIRKTVINHIT